MKLKRGESRLTTPCTKLNRRGGKRIQELRSEDEAPNPYPIRFVSVRLETTKFLYLVVPTGVFDIVVEAINRSCIPEGYEFDLKKVIAPYESKGLLELLEREYVVEELCKDQYYMSIFDTFIEALEASAYYNSCLAIREIRNAKDAEAETDTED